MKVHDIVEYILITYREGHRAVKRQESDIFCTLGSRMAVRLSALGTFVAFYPPPPKKDSWYSFLLKAQSTLGPSAAGRIR
jgi:hypothetical protein